MYKIYNTYTSYTYKYAFKHIKMRAKIYSNLRIIEIKKNIIKNVINKRRIVDFFLKIFKECHIKKLIS